MPSSGLESLSAVPGQGMRLEAMELRGHSGSALLPCKSLKLGCARQPMMGAFIEQLGQSY